MRTQQISLLAFDYIHTSQASGHHDKDHQFEDQRSQWNKRICRHTRRWTSKQSFLCFFCFSQPRFACQRLHDHHVAINSTILTHSVFSREKPPRTKQTIDTADIRPYKETPGTFSDFSFVAEICAFCSYCFCF